MEIKPSGILYSANIIDNLFNKNSHHCYCLIGETLDSLCEGKIKISDIPLISVVQKGNVWITANNRRLWVFRQMERLGKCSTIPVFVVADSPLAKENGFTSASVRENPGGLWYLLPACEMKDPFSIVIWDTAKNIKENMFPPPSRRIIITIFQNLSHAKLFQTNKATNLGRSLEENLKDDGNCSEQKTFSSGYVDVRMGDFNVTQIDLVEKDRRIKQWVVDQNVSAAGSNHCTGIRTLVFDLLSQTFNKPRCKAPYYYSVPGSLRYDEKEENDRFSVVSMISNQGSLPVDTLDENEMMISAASCTTSGYLFVTNDAQNVTEYLTSADNSELQSVSNEVNMVEEDEECQENQNDAMVTNPRRVTEKMSKEIKTILLKEQLDVAEQMIQIESIMMTEIGDIFSYFARKCQTYECEINALKQDIESVVATKNEEINSLTNRVEEAEQKFQDCIKTMAVRGDSLPKVQTASAEDINILMRENLALETRHMENGRYDISIPLPEVICIEADCGTNTTGGEMYVLEAKISPYPDQREAHQQENPCNIPPCNDDFKVMDPLETNSDCLSRSDFQQQENISTLFFGLL